MKILTEIVKTDNSRWMDSIETAFIRITSPSGRSIDIKKHLMGSFSDEERKLIWRCVGNGMVRTTDLKVQVTIPEMRTLLTLSKHTRKWNTTTTLKEKS